MLVAQACLTLCRPRDCSPAGFSVYGILQARILEWVAIPFSRGSSRDRTSVSSILGRFFTIWATKTKLLLIVYILISSQVLSESDTTEQLHFHFSLSCIGEGNGNPLQCSCLENLRDGRAWWAAVCGVAQSQTRLKQLSSSSSSLEWWKSAFKTHDMYNPTELHCLIWIGFKEPLWEERGNHPYTDSSQVIWVNQKTSNWNLIVKLYMLVVTPEMRLAKKKNLLSIQFSRSVER